MTDAQYLFDLAAKQYNETAEVLERHFENVADQIRDWIPSKAQYRHTPPPPPPRRLVAVNYFNKLQSWALRHRAITAGILAFVGTGAVYLLIQRHAFRQKRRARRTASGARTEVVVIAGSALSPLTTALALDLERRGYVVYIVTNSQEEAQHVRGQLRADILPLHMDLVYPEHAQEQVSHVHDLLSRHHHQVAGDKGYRLDLAGVIVIPDAHFQTDSIADTAPETWSNALNAKVLNTVLTTQNLLPLVIDFKGRLLFLAPSIIPSLNPPGHAIQSMVSGALRGFTSSLSAELRPQGIQLCSFRLGHLEIPGSQNRVNGSIKRVKGTPLRRLHDSVFDALQSTWPAHTWHVGRGSLTYDLIGSWIPAGVVGWMMSLSRSPTQAAATEQRRVIEVNDGSSEGSAQWEKIDEMEQASQMA